MWQPRYSNTIEKKLLALRYKLVAAGASWEEICQKSEELIATEQEKARERRKRKADKVFSKPQEHERFFSTVTDEGMKINTLHIPSYCIVIEEISLPFQVISYYNWAIAVAENETIYIKKFTFSGIAKTKLCTVLPDSYILVLHKLDKNGKKCGKLYVDMFLKIFVKL